MGRSPRYSGPRRRGLKARPIHISIPQIPFIESHSIFLQKCTQLILKRLLPVMHLLTIDVVRSALPKSAAPTENAPYPRCHANFDRSGDWVLSHLDEEDLSCSTISDDILCARQANCKMNVVRDPAYAKAFAFGVAGNGGKVRVECRANGRTEKAGTVFCAEDHMDQTKAKAIAASRRL